MKYLSIIIFAFPVLFAQSQSRIDKYSWLIRWSDNVELSVADFLGDIPEEEDRYSELHIRVWAISSCGLRVVLEEENDSINLMVHPLFNKKKSWIDFDGFSQEQIDKLLKHEMGHFNLTEYAARLLRHRVDSLRRSGCYDYQKYWIEVHKSQKKLEELDIKYDEETYHGSNNVLQEKWDRIIKQKLDSLEAYSSSLLFNLP